MQAEPLALFMAGVLTAGASAGVGPVNFFQTPASFAQAIAESGKVSKAAWNFKPNTWPGGGPPFILFPPVDINNPQGAWLDGDWPPAIMLRLIEVYTPNETPDN